MRSASIADRKESAEDGVSGGEEGVWGQEHAESDVPESGAENRTRPESGPRGRSFSTVRATAADQESATDQDWELAGNPKLIYYKSNIM